MDVRMTTAPRPRWTGRRTRWRGERGVSAVLVALVFGSLMIVAAFGVDVGQAYAERRHDQNTVDAAAMSGMVEAALGGGEINEVVAEACAEAMPAVPSPPDSTSEMPAIWPRTVCPKCCSRYFEYC